MRIQPADDSVAEWILRAKADWWQLVTLGPPDYPAYGRLRFIPDPTHQGQSENSVPLPVDHLDDGHQLALALHVLAGYTDTPNHCYVLIWDGWGDDKWASTHARALTTVSLPTGERKYLLGQAHLTELVNELSTDWRVGAMPVPGFVWPDDRSWCLTSDVDPHWAGIAARDQAIQALLDTPKLDVVPTTSETDQPLYD